MNLSRAFFMTVFGIVIGVIIVSHLAYTTPDISPDPYKPYDELRVAIEDLTNDNAILETEVLGLRENIRNLEEDALLARGDLKDLTELKNLVGLNDVHGEGMIVTLDDAFANNTFYNETLDHCHAAFLRDIVNVLRLSGAKAIAINGQRVLGSTTSLCIDNGILLQNIRLVPPFRVVAVGPGPNMQSYLSTRKYLPEVMKALDEGRIQLKTEVLDTLVVPSYTGSFETSYLKKYVATP